VSLRAPLWLIALALIPIALSAARLRRHRPQRHVVRHPASGTIREATAAGSDRRRHVPTVLLLGAVALLVVALAGPRVIHRVGIDDAAIVLVVDHSGSMAASDVRPTRLAAAVAAADRFIDQAPRPVRVGVVGFSDTPDAVQGPTVDHAADRQVLGGLRAGGDTDTGGAVTVALQLLDGRRADHPPAAIVLVSDGSSNVGPNPLRVSQTAARDHVPIDTVALGTPGGILLSGGFRAAVAVPPDPRLMHQIAQLSNARTYDARSAARLDEVYERLARRLTTIARHRDVTVWFVIASAAVLFAAALASLGLGVELP
jgi:Ca-activated chloride channel family protein